MAAPQISFVLPAFNEERLLPGTLAAIDRFVPVEITREVIVVDNGSTDSTPKLASDHGAAVVLKPDVETIGELRNAGAEEALGDVLVFIDADVRLTASWEEHIAETLRWIQENKRSITGSFVGISEDPSALEKNWFAPLLSRDNHHINSGHMLIARQYFVELGGFDELLISGEDTEICERATLDGGIVKERPELFVSHEGFPKTLSEFYKREVWHGRGDCQSISLALRSRVFLSALVLVALHLLTLAMLALNNLTGFGLGIACIVGLVAGLAWIKYRRQPLSIIFANSRIMYVYLWARFASCFAPNRVSSRQRV